MRKIPRQAGVTLVELLVGLALGVFLLAGVLQIYLSSNQTYRTTESLSRLQESARFAIDFTTTDIREAGYRGICPRNAEILSHLGTPAEELNLEQAVRGWNDSAGSLTVTGYLRGDTILVKHATPRAGTLAGGLSTAPYSLPLAEGGTLEDGQVVVLATAEGCDMFALAGAPPTGTGGGSAPAAVSLNQTYTAGTEVQLLRSTLYYVGNGASGVPSLRRMRYDSAGSTSDELVEGILDMQICYGVDTSGNGDADQYQDAAAVGSWDEVVAVRLTVIASSPQERAGTAAASVSFADCDGTVLNRTAADYPELADNTLAQAFTTTIGLRNRLP